jgi:hypothetical protein
MLWGYEQWSQSAEAYEQLSDRFGNDTNPAIREIVAKAMVNMGDALGRAGKAGQERAAYEAVIDKYGHDSASTLRAIVAIALVNRGKLLEEDEERNEASSSYERVLRDYSEVDQAVRYAREGFDRIRRNGSTRPGLS